MIDNIQDLIPINSPEELGAWQKILDNTALIVLLDEQGIIRHVNRKYCAISGFTRHDLVGRSLDSLRSEHDPSRPWKEMWEQLSKGEPWRGEFLNNKKNGETFWEEAVIYPIQRQDQAPWQFVSISSDITSFKNAMQIKDQFMANISHELRTPLHSIYSLSNLLAETQLTREQNDYIENILNSTSILMRMVEDLLDLNKIENGQIRFEEKIFSPKTIVENVRRMFDEKIRQKRLELSVAFDPALPEYVTGDPFRLKQILLHLLENAVKYTPEGYVRLHCRSANEQGRPVFAFEIEDSGIGIAPESLNLIQEKFQQANMAHTRTYGGPGLGLSIVKQLIELQKGSFAIESQQQQGTRVFFSIPFAPTKAETEETSQEADKAPSSNGKPANGAMRVLIAEDVDINQMVIKKHMQKFGFEAEFAENGKIALEKLRRDPFDIVLMDMQMPVMDGYEAIRVIRKEFPEPLCHIPVISITASVMGEAPQKCLDAGANDYVPKPYDVGELKKKMEKWVSLSPGNTHSIPEIMQDHSYNEQEPLIDLDYLEQLSEGDNDFSISMLSYFLDNTPGVLQDMKQFCREGDWKALRNVAHKFKPQLTFMGIKSIFQDVENIEQFANKVENTDQIPALIDRATEVCLKAMEEIRVELEKLLDK